MDMLDIESDELYYEEALNSDAKQCLDDAADQYGNPEAEELLQRAHALEPEHPMVLVALYRFYYYQHRLADSLKIADQVLTIFAKRLGWPADWQDLQPEHLGDDASSHMAVIRFYLLALKGAGFLQLRLGEHEAAIAKLEKVAEMDENDRLGARALLDVAQAALKDTH
jgi:tetratricopeptide (TPR) repeat protein